MLWDAEFSADLTYFILEKKAKRLYNLFKIYAVWKPAHVVMGLNDGRFSEAGLYYIRVNRSLNEKINGTSGMEACSGKHGATPPYCAPF